MGEIFQIVDLQELVMILSLQSEEQCYDYLEHIDSNQAQCKDINKYATFIWTMW